jgi:hypothetical protein
MTVSVRSGGLRPPAGVHRRKSALSPYGTPHAARGHSSHRDNWIEDQDMAQLRLRVTGPEEALESVSESLMDIEGVQRVDEVADLMPRMDDADSSSAGLAENDYGGVGELLVEFDDNDELASLVRRQADASARSAGAALEFIDPE